MRTPVDQLRHAIEWRHRQLVLGQEALSAQVAELAARLDRLTALVEGEVSPALKAVVTEEAENRRRLHAARRAPDYDAAWDDPQPLVSAVIAAYGSPRLLVERALPSLLDQTHPRMEVVVVSDGPSDAIREAVEEFDDARVTYAETTHRVVAGDHEQHWHVASTLPRNLGHQLARGSWRIDFDHDDALRHHAVDRLLDRARAERAEVVYGQLERRAPGEERTERLGSFPPRFREFGWQGAIVHAGLGFFERELVAAAYGLAGDFYRAERMLRVGVRFSLLDEVTCDYYPSHLWGLPGGEEDVADPADVPGVHPRVQREGEQ